MRDEVESPSDSTSKLFTRWMMVLEFRPELAELTFEIIQNQNSLHGSVDTPKLVQFSSQNHVVLISTESKYRYRQHQETDHNPVLWELTVGSDGQTISKIFPNRHKDMKWDACLWRCRREDTRADIFEHGNKSGTPSWLCLSRNIWCSSYGIDWSKVATSGATRRMKTAHIDARTFFSVFYQARARLSTFHSLMYVWHSSMMSHFYLLGLHPEYFTSFCSTTCSATLERASLAGTRTHSSATSLGGQSGYHPHRSWAQNLRRCRQVITLRSKISTEGIASTLRIMSPPQSHRAKLPTVFRRKRLPAVAHNLSSQVKWMLGFTPNRGQLAAGNCCGVMCQTSLMLKKRIEKEKRDRHLEGVRFLSERKDLHVYFEQKSDLLVREVCAAWRQSEVDMETRKFERRSSDMFLFETNRDLESQRLELHQVYQWADQAHRERINLCGQW